MLNLRFQAKMQEKTVNFKENKKGTCLKCRLIYMSF